MKATIKKINELVYPEAKALIAYEPKEVHLEMLLVAIKKLNNLPIGLEFEIKNTISVYDVALHSEYIIGNVFSFDWQLNKTLTEQSESTQQTIKNLFE